MVGWFKLEWWGTGCGVCWDPRHRGVCGSGFGTVEFVSLVTEGESPLVWLGGDGGSSERESRRLLGIRHSGLGCSGVMFLISALAVFLSAMDMN